jgi:4-hydroxybenzoate polyprenyltransferase
MLQKGRIVQAAPSLQTKFRGLVRLTRWKEYISFVVPLTLFGALLSGQKPTFLILVTMLANMLVVAYAFMINDIEDAPDDAREAHRAARNPVACGELSIAEGWIASLLVAVVAMLCFAAVNMPTLIVGTITLALSHFYSWKPVRLKAYPVTDVLSHSLMLSGLLFLAGYFTYGQNPGPVWFVAISLTLVSVYGQLYNQIRDYDMDKAAKLHNTAIMVGKQNTTYLMYAALAAAGALQIYALIIGVLPIWLPLVVLACLPFFYFFRPKTDMRGGQAADITGNMQWQVMLVFNVVSLVWLALVLLR